MSQEVKPDGGLEKKKTSSYTYWVDEKSKGRELPEEHKPKKIDPPPQAANEYEEDESARASDPRNGTPQALGRSAASP